MKTKPKKWRKPSLQQRCYSAAHEGPTVWVTGETDPKTGYLWPFSLAVSIDKDCANFLNKNRNHPFIEEFHVS